MKLKFGHLVALAAFAVAGCAAYFSVYGLSQLFAGASLAVIIMASALEFSKIVGTSLLHRYWSKLSRGLRIYLCIGIITLVAITSAGIYGFLSNAYQKTASKLEIHEGTIGVLKGKKDLFQKNIDDNQKVIDNKNKRIDLLTNLRSNQENRLDSAKNTKAKDKVRADIALANTEIQKLTSDIDGIVLKNNILNDSLNKYSTTILDTQAKSEVAGEVGPLKYLAELTGYPMGKIVNYFIILLIFVFDPMAVALVIAMNRVFEIEREKEEIPVIKAEEIKDVEIVPEPVIEPVIEEVEPISEDISEDMIDDDNDTHVDETFAEEWKEKLSEVIPVDEEPISEPVEELPIEELPKPIEPVVPTGKVTRDDIKEIKEINRGFSVKVPNPKTQIGRIGSNKYKDTDANKVIYRRKD